MSSQNQLRNRFHSFNIADRDPLCSLLYPSMAFSKSWSEPILSRPSVMGASSRTGSMIVLYRCEADICHSLIYSLLVICEQYYFLRCGEQKCLIGVRFREESPIRHLVTICSTVDGDVWSIFVNNSEVESVSFFFTALKLWLTNMSSLLFGIANKSFCRQYFDVYW